MLKFIFGLCLIACVWAKHEQYDGHALYDVTVGFSDQSKTIYDLKTKLDIDVWSIPAPGRAGQVLVPKNLRQSFEEALRDDGIEYNVAVDNIKELLDLEDTLLKPKTRSNRSIDDVLSFDYIPTFDEVDAFLDDLAEQYPQTVTLVTAGQTFEGRDIKYLKISSDNFQVRKDRILELDFEMKTTTKPAVFLQSLLHAREWVSLPVTLYAIKKLVIDVTEQNMVQDVDWIILPIANPDGYAHSHNSRFWRKNRFVGTSSCIGVDLNRNFDVTWGQASSSNPCMDDYHGTGPLSERETSVVGDIFAEFGRKIELYMDMHSYGSMVLYGYGVGGLAPNALGLHVLGVEMAVAIDAVKWANHPLYRVGNIQLILNYAASGGSSDYALAVGTPFSYTYELPAYRGLGSFTGFLVDPDFIEQVGYETWEGIKAGANFILNLNRKNGQ